MMVAARVAGNHTTVTIAGSRGNFELNVMLPVIAHSLLESITLLAGASRAFADRCVAGIEANEQRARELLDRNPAIATAAQPLYRLRRRGDGGQGGRARGQGGAPMSCGREVCWTTRRWRRRWTCAE